MTNVTTIGCDLGDKMSSLCVFGPDGKVERLCIQTAPNALRDFFARPPAHVVVEVGGHSRWVSELLRSMGHRVTVANPRRVQVISASVSKSDRRDAELLARLGRVDTTLLAPITHRGRESQADLAVAKARDALVKSRSSLVTHVRATVKSFGERLPTCTAESFHRRTVDALPHDLRAALLPVYEALAQLDRQVRALDASLKGLAKKHPDAQRLSEVYGVGELTALVYVLTLEDKQRFAKSRMVGAYLGLRPRRNQSGNSDLQLGITKAGDSFLRRLLVNCANQILGPFGKESDLRRWGIRLSERGGKNARKRAKVAVARKLAVLLHRLWQTGDPYQPVGYAQRHMAADAPCAHA